MILVINKNGVVSEYNIKNYANLYTACNYRNNNNFELLCGWNNEYELYGKRIGKAGSENTYEFPSPIDKELFFGTLCIVKKINNQFQPITLNEWKSFYDKQMGGFENIHSDEDSVDSVSSDEEYTEQGYLKDGFVVSDRELIYEEYEEE